MPPIVLYVAFSIFIHGIVKDSIPLLCALQVHNIAQINSICSYWYCLQMSHAAFLYKLIYFCWKYAKMFSVCAHSINSQFENLYIPDMIKKQNKPILWKNGAELDKCLVVFWSLCVYATCPDVPSSRHGVQGLHDWPDGFSSFCFFGKLIGLNIWLSVAFCTHAWIPVVNQSLGAQTYVTNINKDKQIWCGQEHHATGLRMNMVKTCLYPKADIVSTAFVNK